MNISKKKRFVCNLDWKKALESQPAEVRHEVYDAIFEYEDTGTILPMSDQAKMAFAFIKLELDENARRYESTVSARVEAGRKGGLAKVANASKAKQIKQSLANVAVYEDVDVDDNDHGYTNCYNKLPPISSNELMSPPGDDPPQPSEKKNGAKKNFLAPTIEQVRDYIHSRDLNVDAESFYFYYESNGWMVGKSKMKSWEAALLNWNRRDAPPKKHKHKMPL